MSNREIGPVAKELIAAKKRIEDPENWCQHTYCTESGQQCAEAAVYNYRKVGKRIVGGHMPQAGNVMHELMLSTRALTGWDNIIQVNDGADHATVMRCFDHAIQRALSEGK